MRTRTVDELLTLEKLLTKRKVKNKRRTIKFLMIDLRK
jgi:hypothetical protein